MEIEELWQHEDVSVKHYLMVDGYRTWWEDGKSYLCRIFDMLHMRYVDEVLFSLEIKPESPACADDGPGPAAVALAPARGAGH